ncbi:MAG: hypothetical protein J6K20_11765 [Thermoguttaceae bacterium]|nr:hypothetical protein [Thermoguttaceae bacterium]
MKITVLTLQAFIVGLIIGGFYGDALGIRSATESRTIEELRATVATQKKTLEARDATLAKLNERLETEVALAAELRKGNEIRDGIIAELTKANETRDAIVAAQADAIAILQARVREADPPAIPFEFEAPE